MTRRMVGIGVSVLALAGAFTALPAVLDRSGLPPPFKQEKPAVFAALPVGIPFEQRHLQAVPMSVRSVMAREGMKSIDPVLIRIFKAESELEIWKKGGDGRFSLLKTWPICTWSGELGRKKREGDRQSPEGFYTLTKNSLNPRSSYYLSFNLGFPNALERSLGYTGSALMVHGACRSVGCYAMTDGGINEIYPLVRDALEAGQETIQVQAFPFRMHARNMEANANGPDRAFWQNLKEGYDHFEATRREPTVASCGGRYVFNARSTLPFEPAKPCPSLTVSPDTLAAVAEYRARDEADFTQVVAEATPSWRRWLTRLGISL